jgi:prepilin-type N-terminal cleavage/methylation domain-containing protein/prepilin-type processing-associated H-X9-DG protein
MFPKKTEIFNPVTLKTNLKSFTLIELLVVVAIIAVLISILLPSLSQARERAREISCRANLKQLGTAIFMYVDEYQGVLPPLYYNNSTWTRWGWAYSVAPYLGHKSNTVEYFGCEYMRCPTAPQLANVKDMNDYDWWTYGAHFGWSGLVRELPFQANTVAVKMDRIEPCFLVADSSQYASVISRRCYDPVTVSLWMQRSWRHLNKANFLFTDGSVDETTEKGLYLNVGGRWW